MAKAKEAAEWSNRITGAGSMKAEEFKFNPANWRKHPQVQRDAINEIFTKIGWVTGVIVSSRSGHLIDGHARIEEALKVNPQMPIPYTMVDLTEEEERTMLLLLDPIGAMASTDAERFSELAELVDLDTSGLLDVIASVSRANLIDVAELPRQKEGVGEMLRYFKFGDVSIPLSDEELAELNKRYEAYVEDNGVIFGFVSTLLGL